MLRVFQAGRFKRDVKRSRKQGNDIEKLEGIVKALSHRKPLAPKHRDHTLTGNWHGHRECHITPDWLLIYRIEGDVLELVRTGSHAELFG